MKFIWDWVMATIIAHFYGTLKRLIDENKNKTFQIFKTEKITSTFFACKSMKRKEREKKMYFLFTSLDLSSVLSR